MKKLKLKLNGFQEMSKDQMKKISGGYGDLAVCQITCNTNFAYACCWFDPNVYGGAVCECISDIQNHTCLDGGPGSVACRVG